MRRTVELQHDPVDSRQFDLTVKQLADSLDFGPDDSVYHGSGLEYSQSRVYLPGDSVKLIDWRVSARTGKYFIKEYQEPRQIPLYLLLDTSSHSRTAACFSPSAQRQNGCEVKDARCERGTNTSGRENMASARQTWRAGEKLGERGTLVP